MKDIFSFLTWTSQVWKYLQKCVKVALLRKMMKRWERERGKWEEETCKGEQQPPE